jgi:hypothetical protein
VTDDGCPFEVTLEIRVTLDEWSAIRYAIEDAALCRARSGVIEVPFPVFVQAVGKVLGPAVVERMRGHVVGFRPLPLGASAPSFKDRFCDHRAN